MRVPGGSRHGPGRFTFHDSQSFYFSYVCNRLGGGRERSMGSHIRAGFVEVQRAAEGRSYDLDL